MTLFSQVNKSSTKNLATMNALALMVFVLLFITSTLVHANHLTEHSINIEQQECHICHQGIDAPPELPKIQPHSVVSYHLNSQKVIAVHGKTSSFIQPQLRAPPTLQ